MSVSTLTHPEVKEQTWSILYCNELHAKNITGDNVIGAVVPTTNLVGVGDYTMITGSGSPNNTTSIFSKYKTETKEYAIASCSLTVDNVSSPFVGNASQFAINLNMPLGFQMFYPLPGRLMGGGSCVQCVDVGNLSYPTTVSLVNNGLSDFHLRININVHANISAPSATRQLFISFMLNYETI